MFTVTTDSNGKFTKSLNEPIHNKTLKLRSMSTPIVPYFSGEVCKIGDTHVVVRRAVSTEDFAHSATSSQNLAFFVKPFKNQMFNKFKYGNNKSASCKILDVSL